jgi:uncharacterized protein (TIGR03067 family)
MNTILLGLATVLAAPALKDDPKKDSGIVGEWTLESTSLAGKAAKIAANLRYEFTADGQWLIRRDGVEMKSAPRQYKVDPKAKPATFDVTYHSPAGAAIAARNMLGIYKVEGDTLTICYTVGDGERPKSFEPEDGVRTAVMVLKRSKKKE